MTQNKFRINWGQRTIFSNISEYYSLTPVFLQFVLRLSELLVDLGGKASYSPYILRPINTARVAMSKRRRQGYGKKTNMTLISPNDVDIRMALRKEITSTYRDHPDTVVIDELGVCQGEVRVDVAVVNGKIHGYEIKSDRDSLRRLANQVELYSKVLDQATLVAGERHLSAVAAMLPEWWGLLVVNPTSNGLRFETVRPARMNPTRDARALVEFLWLEDSIALLKRYGLDRGVRTKPRRVIWDRICESFDIEVIATAVRVKLKSRAVLPAHS